MLRLKDEYKKFLDDIEKNVKNKEDAQYVKERFLSFFDVVIVELEEIMNHKEAEMKELGAKQEQMESKIQKIQEAMDNIENDIYSEDGFDFEIVCPYCDNEFFIDVDENRTEVECPECNNIIELDWSGDTDDDSKNTGCSGNCSSCGGCNDEDDSNDNEDDM